jgi:metallophosphoesterase superfamily enzyme
MERELVEATLRVVREKASEIVFIRGNHDRGFAYDYPQFAVQMCEHWSCAGVIAIHGDRPTPEQTAKHVLLGHLHPALSVHDDAGASQRIPVFLTGAKASVLPAFSPFAAGYNVNIGIPKEIRDLLGGSIEVLAATGTRVVRLGPLAALRKRLPPR